MSAFLVSQYLAFRSIAYRAGNLYAKTRAVLVESDLDRLVANVERHTKSPYVNLLEDNRLSADELKTITTILGVRTTSDPVLRVLIPVAGVYLFLWRNNSFSYADIRGLTGQNGSIIDHEFIQPVVQTGNSYRTSFPAYLINKIQHHSTDFIEVIPDRRRGSLSSIVIASSSFGER